MISTYTEEQVARAYESWCPRRIFLVKILGQDFVDIPQNTVIWED